MDIFGKTDRNDQEWITGTLCWIHLRTGFSGYCTREQSVNNIDYIYKFMINEKHKPLNYSQGFQWLLFYC